MDKVIIKVENLTREYTSTKGWLKREKKRVQALRGVSFQVNKGEIFGLLGPNGAGKTTTIKILTTLLAPTTGEATVFGYHAFGEEKKIRPRINFIFGGELGVYKRLSGRDNLVYFADLYRVNKQTMNKRVGELLELVGLSDKADFKVETYSKGMIQRLQIARGLINDPEIVFLDEPTIGLDPTGARQLRKIVKDLANNGKTILLTTHYMFEADELCDRVAIINKGKIVAINTPENLKRSNSDLSVLELKISCSDSEDKIKEIQNIKGVENVFSKTEDQIELLQIQCENPSSITQQVLEALREHKVISVVNREVTLEDIYVRLVGGN